MVPRVGRQGKSFRGAALYYLHDKNAATKDRVEHTETRNLPTQDPELGWRVMAFTAKDSDRLKRDAGVDRRGRKLTKPVFHLSTSWHPNQQPDRAHMVQTMDSALAALGLAHHQAVYVIHNDEPHPHIHAFVNLVNPENGRSNSVKYSKERLSRWAEAYEREHGIYCTQRIENNKKRARARADGLKKEFPRHKERELDLKAEITRLYHAADSGQAFRAALDEIGFTLAQGKRIVLIGPDGKVHSITRQLEGISAADVRNKLKGLDLPPAEKGRQERTSRDDRTQERAAGSRKKASEHRTPPAFSREHARERVYADRDGQEREQQARDGDAGIKHQKEEVRTGLLNRLQDAHFEQWGMFWNEAAGQRHRLGVTLDEQYGAHERRLRAAIAEREQKLARASSTKRWFAERFSHDLENLENDRLSLASIEQRKGEAQAALERMLGERRAELEDRHAQEREDVPREFTPRELDPLARSIEQQQAEASAAYMGAAAPAGPQGAESNSASGADTASDSEAADRAAFMDRMSGGLDGPELGR